MVETYTLAQAVGIVLFGLGVTGILVATIVNVIESIQLRKEYKKKYECNCKCDCKKWWKLYY